MEAKCAYILFRALEAGTTGYTAAFRARHSSFRSRGCVFFASPSNKVNPYSYGSNVSVCSISIFLSFRAVAKALKQADSYIYLRNLSLGLLQ